MGLVLSLKKKLKNWVSIRLAELFSVYIKQRAKQISRKQDNSLSTECLQNPLTMEHQNIIIVTSSQDILEKIIMKPTDEPYVARIRKWSIDRLEAVESIGAKDAIYKEFEEWIEEEAKDLLVLESITEVLDEMDEHGG